MNTAKKTQNKYLGKFSAHYFVECQDFDYYLYKTKKEWVARKVYFSPYSTKTTKEKYQISTVGQIEHFAKTKKELLCLLH